MTSTNRGMAKVFSSMGMQEGMGEATRLTNVGRLMEATELIQRSLGNSRGVAGAVTESQRRDSKAVEKDNPTPESFVSPGKTSPYSPYSWQKPSTSPANGNFTGFPGVLENLPLDLSRIAPDMPKVRVSQPSTTDIPAGGQFVSGSFTNSAGTRGYKLYIPSGLDGQSVPLVVMLHGCTQNAEDFAAGTRMNLLAENDKFLVLYPEQSNGANMQKCWNWFQAGDQVRDRGEPSIIAGITRQISVTQPVDTRRIYVAGMSAGAAMAVVMGETYPDLYAAIGVHSGLPYRSARDMPSAFQAMQGRGEPQTVATQNVPTIVFHGDRDTTVNQRNGQQILRRWVSPVDTIENTDAKPLVSVKKGQVPNGHSYTRSTYRDPEGNLVAEGWSIHGAGHAWAGGDPRGSYTDSRGPDASAELVRFFLEHPRR